MLLLALALHIIYYFVGYNSIYSISYFSDTYNYRYSNTTIQVTHVTFGLLITIILILWLFHYLRNNPFKSYYPVSRTYLIKEFLMLVLIFLSYVSIYHTYHWGRLIKKRHLSENIDLVKGSDVINLGLAFLPQNLEYFEKYNCCEIQDSISRLEAINDPKHYCDDNTYIKRDSIKQFRFTYYCQKPTSSGTLSAQQINAIVKRWLKNRNKDSIQMAIQNLRDVCRKYQITSYLDPKVCADYCFADSINFSVVYRYETINDNNDFPYYDQTQEIAYYPSQTIYKSKYYMVFSGITQANEEMAQTRTETFLNITNIYIYFYFAVSLGILLMLFRLLRFKPWIAALLGLGLLMILGGIISMQLSSMEEISLLYGLFTLFCLIMASNQIINRNSKFTSAVFLIWSALFLSALIPVIFMNIYEGSYGNGNCSNGKYYILVPEPPIHSWINKNWNLINWMNISFMMLYFIALIIPLAYKWQANPNE